MNLSFSRDITKRKGYQVGDEMTRRFGFLPNQGPRLFLRRQRDSAETSFRFSPFPGKTWTSSALFLLVVLSLFLPTNTLQAAGSRTLEEATESQRLSPILAAELELLRHHPNYDFPIPVIVQVEPSLFEESRLRRLRVRDSEDRELPRLQAFATRLTGSQIAVLLESPRVAYVTIDAVVRAFAKKQKQEKPPQDDPADPASDGDKDDDRLDQKTNGESAHQRSMGVHLVHDRGITGAGVSVAVFDSGITSHPDLQVSSQVLASVDYSPPLDPKQVHQY